MKNLTMFRFKHVVLGTTIALLSALVIACASLTPPAAPSAPTAAALNGSQATIKVVAVETFLADIAQNVAGGRVKVDALMPIGIDLHAFEPTPGDVKRAAESDVLIVNGRGVEAFLDKLLENAGGSRLIVTASAGLTSREKKVDEPSDEQEGEGSPEEGDPHFWFDPTLAIKYVENIRDGLSQADPDGAPIYQANAESYIAKLHALDAKIKQQVSIIPADRRKLVTDHDTFGYFADRYGFQIVGMLVPSFSTADAATAKQLADLIDRIRASGAKAVFIEQGANPQVAEQIARDTGVKVVTGLYTHSVSAPDGPAPTYLQMLEYDAETIVNALK